VRTMISASEAMALVLEHVRATEARETPIAESLGLVLARDVVADRDYPPFDRSVMDGFAVRLGHAGRTVEVRGEARPGIAAPLGPDDAWCVEIMTGAPCPSGTEAVVMKEATERDGTRVTLPSSIVAGQNIVRAGAECRRETVVVPEGAHVTPIALGLLATVGQASIFARRVPSLAILVTGDEVVQPGHHAGDVEIRDSNGPMLSAIAREHGVTNPQLSAVRDTREALAAALERSRADVVVLTGGVSAGNYDLVPSALAAHGATVVFHKVRQQPGKPILFAVKGSRLFFGLPGTPLGCHLGFHRYVLPALRALAGLPATRPKEDGEIVSPWSTTSERQQFVLAKVERRGASWGVEPIVPRGSSDLFTAWAANAYIEVPEGTRDLPAGAHVTFDWLDGAA
jgi:molybdopterin molybdotransferase